MDKGFFGGLFDMNHDGQLDSFERAMDFMAFDEIVNGSDDSDEEENEEIMDELSFMDEDERREVLEDAGLDPDDYDF